ncbi:hypothetical protein DFH11DRAFT_422407 [Phellopilus nigrolimitatus]|nr:hypothetical protein DFH11DRAFT_422407 [Phellopilus nigrolimitatus]
MSCKQSAIFISLMLTISGVWTGILLEGSGGSYTMHTCRTVSYRSHWSRTQNVSFASNRNYAFRSNIRVRSRVVSGLDPVVGCQTCHIVPHSKGDEVSLHDYYLTGVSVQYIHPPSHRFQTPVDGIMWSTKRNFYVEQPT